MNINFNGESYCELFSELFSDVFAKYDLRIVNRSTNIMELSGNVFSILFTYDLDTNWIYYFDKKEDKTYLISDYINSNAEDIDRKDIPKEGTISKEIERTLKIQSRVIFRKFNDLLSGDNDWFENYKKSQFFQERKTII